MISRLSVYTIPLDVSFLDTLVHFLVHETPFSPQDWLVFLPTQRACAALAERFSDQGVCAPEIMALGSLPSLNQKSPAVLSSFERRGVFARMILSWAAQTPTSVLGKTVEKSLAQALTIGESLAQAVDLFERTEISPHALLDLPSGEYAQHFEEAFEFWRWICQEYETFFSEKNGGDAKDSVLSEAAFRIWRIDQEQARVESLLSKRPVLIAGSTGSVTATARFMKAIAMRANGVVVLPGLMRHMEDRAWCALDPLDAHYGLKNILTFFKLSPSDVPLLPGCCRNARGKSREWLISEVLRPSETTDHWSFLVHKNAEGKQALLERVHLGVLGLSLWEASHVGEEVSGICNLIESKRALGVRSFSVVTPDRMLARWLVQELKNRKIPCYYSAGRALLETTWGAFCLSVLKPLFANAPSFTLSVLMSHPFFEGHLEAARLAKAAALLEFLVLRQTSSPLKIPSLKKTFDRACVVLSSDEPARLHPMLARMAQENFADAAHLAAFLQEKMAPLAELFAKPEGYLFCVALSHHKTLLEALSKSENQGEEGISEREALETLFIALTQGNLRDLTLYGEDYFFVLQDFLSQNFLPEKTEVSSEKIQILGLLEARLLQTKNVVLCGLNEGVWPEEGRSDPWIGRAEKKALGLPSPEQDIGRRAHDFAQNCGAENVWLTWSKKRQGKPVLPSRFILRLEAFVEAFGLGKESLRGAMPKKAEELLPSVLSKKRDVFEVPCPLLERRPTRFSATTLDMLFKNPYVFYVRQILQLSPLPRFGEETFSRDRGIFYHKLLERYHQEIEKIHPSGEGKEKQMFARISEELLEEFLEKHAEKPFLSLKVRQEVSSFASWFLEIEKAWREESHKSFSECRGGYTFFLDWAKHSPKRKFFLTARADRIDFLKTQDLRLIDYKTGSLPSFDLDSQSISLAPFLMGFLLKKGAFEGVLRAPLQQILLLSLREKAGKYEQKILQGEVLEQKIEAVWQGCQRMLQAYEDPTQPYVPVFDGNTPYFRDFFHLCRGATIL